LAKPPFDVLTAVKHVKYFYVFILDCVDNHVVPDRKAAQSGAQVVAGAAHPGILAEQGKALCNDVDDTIGGSTSLPSLAM
jgi:hypothetical protein